MCLYSNNILFSTTGRDTGRSCELMQKKSKNVKKVEHFNIVTEDEKRHTNSSLAPFPSLDYFIYIFCS